MTRQEMPRLFDLLEKLYQGKPRARDEITTAIWAEVLRPWSYAQVRTAVVERARVNRFYPDPSELAERLPQPEPEEEGRYAPPSPKALAQMEALRTWQEAWHRELHEMGLPTMREAEEQGIPLGTWEQRLEEAGAFAPGEADKLL